MSQKILGLFGGTFDPIHFGHLRTALELYQTLDLLEVRMIPCFQPVHRKLPVASPEQRLAMLKEAIISEPALKVDDREIIRKGPSYTIETLISLRAEFPKIPFGLIMGIDALLGFASWHRWEEILNHTHLIIAHRPHYELPRTGIIADLLKHRLIQNPSLIHDSFSGKILLHPVTALEISASDIRKQIMMGRDPRYLLPERTYQYILKHGIYHLSQL